MNGYDFLTICVILGIVRGTVLMIQDLRREPTLMAYEPLSHVKIIRRPYDGEKDGWG